MSDDHLRRDERFAVGVVRAVTGSTVWATDIPGAAPATVDAMLRYPNGVTGALEVTSLGERHAFQLDNLLAMRRGRLANPGERAWFMSVAHPRDLPRLERVYADVIKLMEYHGALRVENLPADIIDSDENLRWLSDESESAIWGAADIAGTRKDGTPRPVYLHATMDVAIWSNDGDEISRALTEALQDEPCKGHIAKLLKVEADERHLFLIVAASGLSPAAYMSLVTPENVPTDTPSVPAGITHIWLETGYGQSVTRWSREEGWAVHSYQ